MLYYCSMLTFAQFIRNLRTFVVKSALSRLRALWEALLAKIWWGAGWHKLREPGSLIAKDLIDSEDPKHTLFCHETAFVAIYALFQG